MKQRVFKFIMVFILFGFVVSLTYTFAWYTYTSKIGKIDADTKDIAFTYTFNDSDEINVNSYSITNLTFFDIDDPYELKYFNDMHTVIKLDIENYSSDIIDYTIDFSTEISEIKDDENVISRAYVIGFITTSDDISITDNGSNSISNYIQGNKNENVFSSSYNNDATNPLEISDGNNQNSSVTLYLHLLGVQEIDTANNDFLFDKIDKNGAVSYKAVSYSFTLTIKAVGRTKDPTINTTPSGTSTPATSGTTSTTSNGTITQTTSGTTSTTSLTTTSTVAE